MKDHQVADNIPASSVLVVNSIMGTGWAFKVEADGRFEARLVVQGWAQRNGLDCWSTPAPVCQPESQRLLLSMATASDRPSLAIDTQAAFETGNIKSQFFAENGMASRPRIRLQEYER